MASSSDNPIKRLIRETHRRSLWQVLVVLAASVLPGVAAGQAPLQFADLGTCELESGEVIRDCRVGYRTFGRLNAERSNAILFPTALWNRTDAAGELFGPQGLLDTSERFVIAVDAFGNGVSSSPSNSPTQGGASFPQFTIRDMVNSQYVNAPVRVNLYTAAAGTTFSGSGTVAQGAAPAPRAGADFDSVMVLLRNGNAYVNVHTVANPGGELRGQIVP